MSLGWPVTLLLVLAIGTIIFLYVRAEAVHRQRKLDAVQKRLADIEARKARNAENRRDKQDA